MFRFLKECKGELNKVVWPDREEVMGSTVVVLISVVVISIFLFASDSFFEGVFNFFISLGTGT